MTYPNHNMWGSPTQNPEAPNSQKQDDPYANVTPRDVLLDPEFYKIPIETRRMILIKVWPDFSSANIEDQDATLNTGLDFWKKYLSDISTPVRIAPAQIEVGSRLAKEREAIEIERDKAVTLSNELDQLARELETQRRFLDTTSQYAIDQYNAKIQRHNEILEQLRAQEQLVNKMVDEYNAKLRHFRRQE